MRFKSFLDFREYGIFSLKKRKNVKIKNFEAGYIVFIGNYGISRGTGYSIYIQVFF